MLIALGSDEFYAFDPDHDVVRNLLGICGSCSGVSRFSGHNGCVLHENALAVDANDELIAELQLRDGAYGL